MNIFNELDDQGFDRKEVAAIVKLKTKPLTSVFKLGVNTMCEMVGLKKEFDLSPEQEKEALEDAEQKDFDEEAA